MDLGWPTQTLQAINPLGKMLSVNVRIGKLQIQPIAIEPEPDATNEAAKDELDDIVPPCDVQVILGGTADQEANAPPQLPCIDPEG